MPLDADTLCRSLDISPRTLRNWIREGIVARPARRGPATVYDDGSVLRARAAAALRKENLTLRKIRRELDKASTDELRALAGETSAEPPAPEAPPEPAVEEPVVAPPPEVAPAEALPGAGWRHIVLMEGLELHLADDASPIARRVAADIAAGRWGDQNVSETVAKPPEGAPATPKRTDEPAGRSK